MTEKGNFPRQRKLTDKERIELRNEHWSWLGHIMIGAIDGILIGLCVGIAIIVLDINGIGSMLAASDSRTGFTWLLLAGLAQTFGMVSAGLAVWIRATQEKD